jgi:2-polyprenyl-6-methoxyphenol hydroxylase-like FAD-dependent oxidoreductase
VGGLTGNGDVLIVGAGPVGLLFACELAQQGVRVRLIDADRGATAHSRANVVWPRNLELLGRIGVTGELIARGHRLAGTAFYGRGRHLSTAWMSRMADAPYPFALMISQSETEQVLRDRLEQLGGSIETGVRLVALDNSGAGGGDRPAAKLEHPDGRSEEVEPDWLIGADGAHSTVRKQLGVGYTGPQVDVSFAITDARLSTSLSGDLSHYCYAPSGAIVLGPMGGGVYRIAVNVPHDAFEDEPPPLELFQRLVDERAAGRTHVDDLLWSGAFRVRVRLAESFRRGRCFLVGDAAHVISPAGGQGMNTGLQDAVNLAWKLSGVLRGDFAEELLDTYDTERREVSHRVARSSALLTKAGVVNTPVRMVLRDTAFRVADRTGLFQRHLAPQLSQTDISYGDAHPRLPVLMAGEDRPDRGVHWPAVARDRHTVLLWPGPGTPPASWRAACARIRAALPEGTPVLELDRAVPPALARALGPRAAVVLVRPDGHLHARTALERVGELTAALDGVARTAP